MHVESIASEEMTMPRNNVPSLREIAIMAILQNGERYGLEIREQYEKRTPDTLPLGSLYVVLRRLEDLKLVTSRVGESVAEFGGNRRKYFTLTAAGNRSLRAAEQIVLTAQLGGVCVSTF